jgi:hypothetical protein
MRSLLIALAAALLVPAAASAAPFEELPFQTVPGGTTCLRPTGTPGELVAWAHGGARLFRADAAGLSGTTIAVGDTDTCPAAATQANGAGVIAAATPAGISVALREPGGTTWAAPVQLPLPKRSDVQNVTAAVSERGDALVIWAEEISQRRGSLLRLRAARRPAGGAFGAPQTLATSDSPFFNAAARAGIAADGTAIVAWSHFEGRVEDPHSVADLAIAAPGAPFAAGQRLTAELGGELALAVAPDGHALAAYADAGRVRVAERAPGGGFGTPQTVGSGSGGRLAVALGTGGAALVAWSDEIATDISYARRTDASGFRPPVELSSAPLEDLSVVGIDTFGGSVAVEPDGGTPRDYDGSDLRAAYASGDRVVLSWGEPRAHGRIGWTAAHVATVAPDDSYAMQIVSGPLRDADSIAPVVLGNGIPAVAWSDNGDTGGRTHLAAEGATAVPRPVPQVHVGKPERAALRRTQTLVVPVTCSAACDLRATARGLTASASLSRAGTVKLRFLPTHAAAPARPARVPITVLSGAPGARATQSHVIRPRLRRIPDPPLARVLDLTAIRSGSTVTVTWRLDRADRQVQFIVYSSTSRDGDPGPVKFVDGSSKTAVNATLRHVPATNKYVNVQWGRGDGRTRHASVKIR